ncbi:MAG: transglutaminase domain-containing protein [Candidatus Hodarchaeaceae archaeon]|nr:transglutaminase domain-containing protein [Candidatus Hodarchaeaceae archaeon]
MAAVAFLLIFPTPAAVAQEIGYYELTELNYIINENRSVDVQMKFILYIKPAWSISGASWRVPSTSISNVQVWPSPAQLDKVELVENDSIIHVKFQGGLGPNKRLAYNISFTAEGLVSGIGSEYRGILGNRADGGYEHEGSVFRLRHDNYIVVIQGPADSYLFFNDWGQSVENNPPTLRYENSFQAHENFQGLRVRFYNQPAFYRVTLRYPFTNYGSNSTTDLNLDAMLFNSEVPWQFSALIYSSHPIQTMYVDEENNWHGVFRVSELTPGETETITLELLYEVLVHDPGISAEDVGYISDVPASLQEYLKPDDKWESDSSVLKQAAEDAIGTETRVYLAAEKISGYVVNRLNYQVQDNRHGALWAYLNRTGDCSEYTDLSIALARASGIPARAMYGWGYYEEENLRGHAWLEYYFPGVGWQPADPTWDETFKAYFARLDPIHLTRNVRGLSSEESGASYTYYGALPTLSEGETTITPLKRVEAAQEFVRAAQYAVNLADAFLEASPDETLQAKQNDAKQALAQAQAASDENQKILYAKNSLQNANEVIRALGRKPPQPTISIDFEKLFPYLAAVGVVIAVALVAYGISRRRGKG